jgi:hypothetical protein
MVTYDRRALHKGGNVASDDEEFLKANTNPWKASSSGQDSRWSDDRGYERGEQSRGGSQAWESRGADDASFLAPSQSQTDWDAPHERLSKLIDGQTDQPAGPILGGGGKVSSNKVGGVGAGPPRYKVKTGPQGNDGL